MCVRRASMPPLGHSHRRHEKRIMSASLITAQQSAPTKSQCLPKEWAKCRECRRRRRRRRQQQHHHHHRECENTRKLLDK